MTLLVQPVWSRLLPACEEQVRELERRGVRLMRAFGSLGVDRVRSHLASRALHTDHEWWIWLDSDMVAPAEALLQLVDVAKEHGVAWLAASAVCRGSMDLNIRPLHGTDVVFGPDGGLVEVAKGALACAVTHRRLFEALAKNLPEVDYTDDASGERFTGWPFFLPVVRDRTHYGEDYSLALRAREAGFRIWCDTRFRVGHNGEIVLGWEHAKNARVTG